MMVRPSTGLVLRMVLAGALAMLIGLGADDRTPAPAAAPLMIAHADDRTAADIVLAALRRRTGVAESRVIPPAALARSLRSAGVALPADTPPLPTLIEIRPAPNGEGLRLARALRAIPGVAIEALPEPPATASTLPRPLLLAAAAGMLLLVILSEVPTLRVTDRVLHGLGAGRWQRVLPGLVSIGGPVALGGAVTLVLAYGVDLVQPTRLLRAVALLGVGSALAAAASLLSIGRGR